MKKKLFYISILIILTLSACGGGEATPTIDAAALQETALANAWLAMTQTQAAIPTATATFTPAPTDTPVPTFVTIPTLPPLQPAQPTAPMSAPTTDPCYNPPPAKPLGAMVKVKFVNKSEGSASLSFGMMQPNAQGECATYSFSLGVYDAPVVPVLAGCYWAYAYITSPKGVTSNAANPQPLCVYDTSKAVSIWIGKEAINFH